MPSTTTMTIRIGADVKDKLDRLARSSRRSKSLLAAEAVAGFVERELEIIEGLQRGLADVERGRVVSHEQAVAEIDEVINAAERDRRA